MTQPPPMPTAAGGYRPPAPRSDDVIRTLIPYRNTPALVSYYLGVFSLIPCVGAILGIAAVVLGIMGLKVANKNPDAKGKAHAIVGIICGGLFGLIWIGLTVVVLIGILLDGS